MSNSGEFDEASDNADTGAIAIPGTATATPWHLITLALTVKLFSQAAGAAAIALAMSLPWSVQEIRPDGHPELRMNTLTAGLVIGLGGLAIGADVAGRLLCLVAPPSLRGRWTIWVSVAAQEIALIFAAFVFPWPFYPDSPNAAALRLLFLLAALLLQFIAALFFTGFLRRLAQHFQETWFVSLAWMLGTCLAILAITMAALTVAFAVIVVLGLFLAIGLPWVGAFLAALIGIGFGVAGLAVITPIVLLIQGCYTVLVAGLAIKIYGAMRGPPAALTET
jgi:hypothetical protein